MAEDRSGKNMRHLAIIIVSVLVCSTAVSAQGSTTVYNSSEACLVGSGRNRYIQISCGSTPGGAGHLYIRRILQGLTPDSMGCTGFTSPASNCCPGYDASRDCLFSTHEELEALRDYCDDLVGCTVGLERARVHDACPSQTGDVTYLATYSHFAFVEYSCIDPGLMVDVCTENMTFNGTELYLKNHRNTDGFNQTCNCIVSTQCGHRLVFHIFDLELKANDQGQCQETVTMTDSIDSSISASLNCSDNGTGEEYRTVEAGDGEGNVFMSLNYAANFQLNLLSNVTGKFLIRVTASGGAPVEVRCGQPAEEDSWKDDQCLPVSPTTSATTTTQPVTTFVTSPTTMSDSPSTAEVAPEGTTDIYNSTDVCLVGPDRHNSGVVEIDCSVTEKQGLVVVRRVWHGLPPDSVGCHPITSPDSCCQGYDASRDCMFPTDEGVSKLREICDGLVACSANLDPATVGDACPSKEGGVSYSAYSTFAKVEYTCVNTGLMTDFCDIGTTRRDTEVYLETNIYHTNGEHANKTCPCTASTLCGHKVIFHALDLDLGEDGQGQCQETLVFTGDSMSTSLNCSDNGVDDEHRTVPIGDERGSVFVSSSNLASVHLQLLSSHTGRILLRVSATDGAQVEVRCGSTAEQEIWNEHRCPTNSPVTTTAASSDGGPSTTIEQGRKETPGESKLNTGVIAGIIVAAVIICLIIFILVILICKRGRKTVDEEQETTAATNEAGYSTIHEVPENNVSAVFTDYNTPDSLRNSSKHDYTLLNPGGGLPTVVLTPDTGAAQYSQHVLNTDSEEGGAVGGFENPVFEYEKKT